MNCVAMLGEGAWGSAIATVLAHNNVTVKLWCHDAAMPAEIVSNRCNTRYLPDISFSAYIQPSASLADVVTGVQDIFIAIPVQHLRSVLTNLKPFVQKEHRYILLCKGIERGTFLVPTQLLTEVLGNQITAVVAGPSFAYDVARKQLTGVVVASHDPRCARDVQTYLTNAYFKTEYSTDMSGVQFGAALKNVVGLMAGMLDGAGYSASTKAYLVTRMFHEMVFIASQFGAQAATLYHLSGLGDMILTAYGSLSKNYTVGRQIGAGKSVEQIIQETGFIPEGVNTVKALLERASTYRTHTPLLIGVGDIIEQRITIHELIASL